MDELEQMSMVRNRAEDGNPGNDFAARLIATSSKHGQPIKRLKPAIAAGDKRMY